MTIETQPYLAPIEVRILGCLIEKEATTPDVYPLTVNNVVAACNQKTAREPVMALQQGEVHHALRQMEVHGWVKSQHTVRAERYAHRFAAVWSLTAQQTALMALLMLRGPQTVYELLSRSERLCHFDGVEQVQHVLERLSVREPPLVAALPRRSGQREDRFHHCLLPPPELGDEVEQLQWHASAASASTSSLHTQVQDLQARLDTLEKLLVQAGVIPATDESMAQPNALPSQLQADAQAGDEDQDVS